MSKAVTIGSSLTGTTTLSLNNIKNGRGCDVIISHLAGGATITLAYNADWKQINALPTTLNLGESVRLTFLSTGTLNSTIYVEASQIFQ